MQTMCRLDFSVSKSLTNLFFQCKAVYKDKNETTTVQLK